MDRFSVRTIILSRKTPCPNAYSVPVKNPMNILLVISPMLSEQINTVKTVSVVERSRALAISVAMAS
jgi:hypothetical protein